MPYTPEQIRQFAKEGATEAIQEYMSKPDNRLFKFLRQLVGSKG